MKIYHILNFLPFTMELRIKPELFPMQRHLYFVQKYHTQNSE